jgi:hypothetical protein
MSIQGDQPKKRQRPREFEPKRVSVNMRVPREFETMCQAEQIAPGELLRQFIADLCNLRAWTVQSAYDGNGEAAHRAALSYHLVASRARRDKKRANAEPPDAPR